MSRPFIILLLLVASLAACGGGDKSDGAVFRFGDRQISTTLDIYGHLMPSRQRQEAAKIDEALRSIRKAN